MIEPFFFGSEERLFGAFHPARDGVRRRTAVLVAYPLGLEYDLSHRALVRLSEMLAGEGFPVLRFDYRGCGDSAGGVDACTIPNWLADMRCAEEELHSGTGAETVCLLGLRFGASLAWLHAAAGTGSGSLVLWAPVVDGRAYSAELERRHKLWLIQENLEHEPVKSAEHAIEKEYLGFPVTRKLAGQLDDLDLCRSGPPHPGKVLLLDRRVGSAALKPLTSRITLAELELTELLPDENPFWFSPDVVVPLSDLKLITSWVCEHHR